MSQLRSVEMPSGDRVFELRSGERVSQLRSVEVPPGDRVSQLRSGDRVSQLRSVEVPSGDRVCQRRRRVLSLWRGDAGGVPAGRLRLRPVEPRPEGGLSADWERAAG